jgi:alkylation response protein AidB-like acyl-CoA dehydrogenase
MVDIFETDERKDLRKAVSAIANDFGHEYFLEKARSGQKSTELWQAVGKAGYLGVNISESYGGGGCGIYEMQAVGEELAAAGCPLLMTVVSPTICGSIIEEFGSDELKARWLPGIASGETIMAFAITEPDAGSNSHNISTNAKKVGGEWVLRGTKYYISGVDEADAILVVTRTSTDDQGRGRLSLIIVPTDAPGLERTVIPVECTTPEKQFTLFFDDVRVPLENLIGQENDGLRQVFQGLNPERILGASLGNGIGRYALDKAAAYARDRKVWDVPIGAHQGIAHPLAHAKIQVELARLMTQKAATLHDAGDPGAGEASNMAKYSAADAGLLALDQAIQTHGGNGMATEYGLATLYGPARLLRTAPISREMILNFVAQHSLQLPRSY